MRSLLLAGEGPYFKNSDYLNGSLFDEQTVVGLERSNRTAVGNGFSLKHLYYQFGEKSIPLLRSKRGKLPHLTSFTLESILQNNDIDYELFRLESLWDGEEPSSVDFDVVLLSTTFICEQQTFGRAIKWITERIPQTTLIVGGQYSNLKYKRIMQQYPQVAYIIRGDSEEALPRLLRALEAKTGLENIPNLVMRGNKDRPIVDPALEYIDLESYPSPSFLGTFPTVPYESMRGCPFSCKFCSFPAASPQWRYKSAEKISSDWIRYKEQNGASIIRAMDSTFTVPPTRLRQLMSILPSVGIHWEAYTRANSLKDKSILDALANAGCRLLSIGFESMSDSTLRYMNKLVTRGQNLNAFELLKSSSVGYRISFMVGYPGETPEDFSETYQFLVSDYEGHFMMSVFSLIDETMPVWQDAERFNLRVFDRENPDYAWEHSGMDVHTARQLMERTLHDVRWQNEDAVHLLWQSDYETPLLPHLPKKTNLHIEKLVERLAMLPIDYPAWDKRRPLMERILQEMQQFGIGITKTTNNPPCSPT